MTPDDKEQLQIIRPQNDADIEAVINQYHRLLKVVAINILRIVMSPGAADFEAEEVLQDVYFDVWKKGSKRVNKSLVGYLVRMTRYKAIDCIRGRRSTVELDETMTDDGVDVEKDFEANDLFRRAFSEMTLDDQQILRYSIEGHSGKDIASTLKTGENTARSKISRTKHKFKSRLDNL
jgi:RNA polymerase sigma factor (sigma-70 family)